MQICCRAGFLEMAVQAFFNKLLSALRTIRLAKSFRHYVESDLAVCESWMVAQVPGARRNTAPERAATEYSELQTVE
jgi:hypothetical protein